MSERVEARGVILRGDDLNPTYGPWRRVNRANNLRLLPIALGFVVSSALMGSLANPSLLAVVASTLPLLLGWFAFIWQTNAHYLGAYKDAYEDTSIGRESCDFAFDQIGMLQNGQGYECRFEWRCFAEIVEDEKAVRLWMTPFMAIVLPKRYLDEQSVVGLRALVADARARGDIRGTPE